MLNVVIPNLIQKVIFNFVATLAILPSILAAGHTENGTAG